MNDAVRYYRDKHCPRGTTQKNFGTGYVFGTCPVTTWLVPSEAFLFINDFQLGCAEKLSTDKNLVCSIPLPHIATLLNM